MMMMMMMYMCILQAQQVMMLSALASGYQSDGNLAARELKNSCGGRCVIHVMESEGPRDSEGPGDAEGPGDSEVPGDSEEPEDSEGPEDSEAGEEGLPLGLGDLQTGSCSSVCPLLASDIDEGAMNCPAYKAEYDGLPADVDCQASQGVWPQETVATYQTPPMLGVWYTVISSWLA